MYQIYADNTLIYDSTLEDYKIGKGSITLETNKSGSFTFSLYPDHFFYDEFVKLRTVITVYKSGKIIFRGRVLNDVTDYWNNKVLTCEGELGFLQDSIIRPFDFKGTPSRLLENFIEEHNAQVDDFKQFKLCNITVVDNNDYIARSNSGYESTLANMNSRLIEDSLGGYFYITHGEDGTDPIPTLNYLADFTKVSAQTIEFGVNLKNYTKTVKADDIATAIIPLGAQVDDGNSETENPKLTIASVNDGKDYVYSEAGVALYGWIFKTLEWNDVTDANNLKRKAEEQIESLILQNVTIELTAIDLHLIDPSIDYISVGDYVRVVSTPHNFSSTMLCNKQTIDLLKPENDSLTLGYAFTDFTGASVKSSQAVKTLVEKNVTQINQKTNAYIKAEQQLTSLMAQSFGVFKSTEALADGSTIQYLHDKPTLEESTNVWKMTADAFAVSTDGGKTWNAGLSASGDAILNALAVIGIEATWINCDNLSAISANIGGWEIDDDAIVKEVSDTSNENIKYKVVFKPPTKESVITDVLTCQKSTDGGQTFTNAFRLLSNGRAIFGDTTVYEGGAIYFGEKDEDCKFFSIGNGGFNFFDRTVDGNHTTDKTTAYWSTNASPDGTNRSTLHAEDISWDTYAGSTPYSGSVTIDGKVFRFRNGVLLSVT